MPPSVHAVARPVASNRYGSQQDIDRRDDRVGPAPVIAGQQPCDNADHGVAMPVEVIATISETLAPYTVRLKTSRPIWSTPKMCCELGPVAVPKIGDELESHVGPAP